MSSGQPKITVYIMSFNEVRQIRAVLESVKWADELIVVDSFSTDGTVEIAREFGARIISEKFCGFGRLRNFALDASQNDWMVSIDSDERCVPEFVEELRRTLAAPQHAAYHVPRLNTFLGGPVKHGGMYPDYRQPQVFNRQKFRYREDLVHEGFDCSGSIGYFKTPIWQHPWPTLAVILWKMDRYTTLMAQRRFENGKHASILKMVFAPPIGFVRKYIMQQGFRDGMRGFIMAAIHVCYTFLKYAKLWELELIRKQK
jgi:glycosyltransferase involved in cell wall biosynthesis